MTDEDWDDCDHQDCVEECWCGRGRYRSCQYKSCYDCFLDRRADYLECIFCGRWHSPQFDTCFKCRPQTQGRDDPARALRQLILHRDEYACRGCGAKAGDLQPSFRDPDTLIPAVLHVDHIVPCKVGGTADEWNLQVLCALHNYAKGSIWYVGCRYERVKTELCRLYFLLAPTYFDTETRARFNQEVALFRETNTWDPTTHKLVHAGERLAV